ncbi:MAG TPA: hypothetical protein VKB88_21120 [Bryobacteraceae bacterium]|nr:hypothetical protein [Bryobacteraceae bacterium]
MIENSLELRRGFRTSLGGQVRLAAHVNGIEGSEIVELRDAGHGQIVSASGLQPFERGGRFLASQCEKRAQHRQVVELNRGRLAEP